MKTEQIIENNRLIAEFMKYELTINYVPPGVERISLLDLSESDSPNAMKFHYSWDWLMPVIEKIEGIGRTRVEISGQYCSIVPLVYDIDIDELVYKDEIMRNNGSMYNTTKINKVYVCVVEFIKWYNENK